MSSSRLRIVPSFTDVTSQSDANIQLDGHDTISGENVFTAFSLYFEWEEYRSALLYKTGDNPIVLPCSIDYDRDERNPSELRVTLSLPSNDVTKIDAFSVVSIRLEIFGFCYIFDSTVTAIATAPHEDGWNFILKMPNEVQTRRSRRLPRYTQQVTAGLELPKITWISEGNPPVLAQVVEIGIRSLSVTTESKLNPSRGTVTIEGQTFQAELIRSSQNKYSFNLGFEKSDKYGSYFDVYRKYTYPSLRFRGDLPYEAAIELYEESKYFETGPGGLNPNKAIAMKSDWKAIDSGAHQTNADYYAVDENGKAVASAGLALCNYIKDRAVWSFHQLCALKRPDLVSLTGELHRWRVEYLAGRPESLVAVVWFNSNSRWVERMYAKHAMTSTLGSKVLPILDRRCTFKKGESDEHKFEINSYQVGTAHRFGASNEKLWGAVGPRFFNANENLDTIVVVDKETSIEEINSLAQQLISNLKVEELSLLVTVPADFDIAKLGGEYQKSDRLGYFPKEDLVNLLYSMEHSIAVTERKLASA
jgi:hypothetical protein